ncbi:MAG: 50S ribosomal protein L29 [Desulfovibrionaceae bacterium]|nr:50S ribosomal protein L29 [Desulfovibrionaceae bacterium]
MADKDKFPTVSDLRTNSLEELKGLLSKTRTDYANLRFQHKLSNLQNVKLLSASRKHIAQILTVIKEKEQEI